MSDLANLPDPCSTRKIAAFILSIVSPIPGAEAIVWKCNTWGRVVAVTALLKVLLLVIGIALIASGASVQSMLLDPEGSTTAFVTGLYLIVVFGILSFVQVIFTALAWTSPTYESVYIKDMKRQKATEQRIKASLT